MQLQNKFNGGMQFQEVNGGVRFSYPENTPPIMCGSDVYYKQGCVEVTAERAGDENKFSFNINSVKTTLTENEFKRALECIEAGVNDNGICGSLGITECLGDIDVDCNMIGEYIPLGLTPIPSDGHDNMFYIDERDHAAFLEALRDLLEDVIKPGETVSGGCVNKKCRFWSATAEEHCGGPVQFMLKKPLEPGDIYIKSEITVNGNYRMTAEKLVALNKLRP